MKSRTSFFNATALKKDLTRFAPLCGIYLFYLLLVYFRNPPSLYRDMTYPLFVYAGVCGVVLFGDLYDPRRCGALHAMPLRREGWFLVHSLAGFLFFLIPTVLFHVVVSLIWSSPDRWLATVGLLGSSSLTFVCFFGLALLCAMVAGNRIGAVLLYGVVNFLSPAVQWIVQQLYEPFLQNVAIDTTLLSYLSPVVRMAREMPGYYYMMTCTPPWDWSWSGDWGYFLICAGVGIVAAVLALLLYRRRKLERAGSFSVFPGLRYVFTAAASVMAGVAVFELLGHSKEQYYFLFLYIPIFYFATAMLVEKRFHVFRPGHLLTLGILAAVLFNSIWIVRYDVLGISTYVPKAEGVQSVRVYVDSNETVGVVPSYSPYRFTHEGTLVTDPVDIDTVTQAHRSLLENRAFEPKPGQSGIYLTYRLKSGITLRRYYFVHDYSEEGEFDALAAAISSRQSIFGDVDWETYPEQVYSICVSNVKGHQVLHFAAPEDIRDASDLDVKIHSEEFRRELLQKLLREIDKGNLLQTERTVFRMTVKSKNRWGNEKTVVLNIPRGRVHDYIENCWNTGRKLPDKTIPADQSP